MKIYDISQEVFGCAVYPGDPAPIPTRVVTIEEGSLYNLSKLEMCAHNGTHMDAPYHFLQEGKTIDQISLKHTVGWCYVAEFNGQLTKEDIDAICTKATAEREEAANKILFKGKATVTAEAATRLKERGVHLVGVESQTVGPEDGPMEVHLILLGAEVCLLEGLRLSDVTEGVYFLHAAPLNLAGFDGSPCRATLIRF